MWKLQNIWWHQIQPRVAEWMAPSPLVTPIPYSQCPARTTPIFDLCCHFNFNYTPVKFHDCIDHPEVSSPWYFLLQCASPWPPFGMMKNTHTHTCTITPPPTPTHGKCCSRMWLYNQNQELLIWATLKLGVEPQHNHNQEQTELIVNTALK